MVKDNGWLSQGPAYINKHHLQLFSHIPAMKKPVFLVALAILLFMLKANAQQPFQLWLTYNHQARVTNKWGYTFDLNYRSRGVFPFTGFLTAARMGIVYQLNPVVRFTAGYAWFGGHIQNRDQRFLHENRLYEQVQFNNNKKHGLRIAQRIRLEQRFRQEFVADTNDIRSVAFTFRARYLFQLQGPLKKKKGTDEVWLSWQVADEIFLHAGENLNNNYFDQNRTLAGVVISLIPKMDVAVLYQLIIQRQPIAETTQFINSVRIILFHNLDFRKK
jgi:Protein of unknown function (DUF2490)